jgi:hypothetical protein
MPNQRYVLLLRHIKYGEFYLLGDSITISNGMARPNSADAVNAAKAGEWPFSSMDESPLID